MAGVLLGTIQFANREVPDFVSGFGGKQALAIHRLIGGRRVIDALGPDPDTITWEGLFYGPSAATRARAVQTLCNGGAEVALTWGSFSYLVIVSDFKPKYKHEWEISYSISCEVSDVLSAASAAAASIDSIIGSDFTSINAVANASPALPALAGIATIPTAVVTAISAAQTAITTVAGQGSLADASLAQLQPAIAAAQQAYQTLSAAALPPTGIDLDAITGTSTIDGINAFANEAGLVAGESDIQTAIGYLGRIVNNLNMLAG